MKCMNLQATEAMNTFQITQFIQVRLAPASLTIDYSCSDFFKVKLSHKCLFTSICQFLLGKELLHEFPESDWVISKHIALWKKCLQLH